MINLLNLITPRKSAQNITRAEALRLFNLINEDTIPAATCNEIGEVSDVIINESGVLNTRRNKEVFIHAMLDAWPQTTSSYFRYWKKELRTILDRAQASDDPAQIIADLKAR